MGLDRILLSCLDIRDRSAGSNDDFSIAKLVNGLLIGAGQFDFKLVGCVFTQIVHKGLIELIHDAGIIFGTETEGNDLFGEGWRWGENEE